MTRSRLPVNRYSKRDTKNRHLPAETLLGRKWTLPSDVDILGCRDSLRMRDGTHEHTRAFKRTETTYLFPGITWLFAQFHC